ncbi:MAG TPA: VOC family protein [Acidimicrobiales bacterium]|nr:VOC family protein [Acidimicrobiales bacterium]
MALQVTFDCADPHALARFWAVATDFQVDDHHDMIGELIEGGQVPADSEDVVEVDGRRRWRDYASATPKDPADGNRLLFQRVPEGKTAKNRVHLDLHPPDGTRDELVQTLIGLGARKLWDGQQGPMSWITLADPEGNELCVA